ncbi:hypothetical protein D910_02267 [Dendroctonus ponderosae]|uniref:Uncharacterized protein n=1 Tax=Dendroctonus ponderosae TaxID=77166 RepID=U4TXZ0_DENPD|nr:hypothetical protein D910_02267 [Dendroctonus ponderosae]
MKGGLIIALLCFSCVVGATADWDKVINGIATIVVAYIETLLKAGGKEYVLLVGKPNGTSLNYSNIIEGDIHFTRIYLYGLDGLVVNTQTINIQWNSSSQTLILGLNISVPNEVGITICLPSKNTLIKAAFDGSLADFRDDISKGKVVEYIETGADYFTKKIECYLADK